MKKYEILYDNKIELLRHTLYRIRACKNFGNVKAGDLGGYIEKPENLSQYGDCWVYDNAWVYDEACIRDNARVCGTARVSGNACVYGDAQVYDNARVYGNAQISKDNDVLYIAPIGSRDDATTFFKTKDNNICVTCGCFYGTIDEFLERVSETHGENKHAKAYKLACMLARVQIELEDI